VARVVGAHREVRAAQNASRRAAGIDLSLLTPLASEDSGSLRASLAVSADLLWWSVRHRGFSDFFSGASGSQL